MSPKLTMVAMVALLFQLPFSILWGLSVSSTEYNISYSFQILLCSVSICSNVYKEMILKVLINF